MIQELRLHAPCAGNLLSFIRPYNDKTNIGLSRLSCTGSRSNYDVDL